MKKYMIFIIFLFLTLAPNSYAADVNFSCDESNCTPSTATSFLPNTLWYPGKTITKTVKIENTTSNNRSISLKAVNKSSTRNLQDVIQLSIQNTSTNADVWNGGLSQLYGNSLSNITSINPNSSTEYSYTFAMNLDAGNEYQNAHTTFDLQIGLEDVSQPTITPTVSPTPISSGQQNNSSDSGGSNSTSSNLGGSSDSSVLGASTAQNILSEFSKVADILGLTNAIQDISDAIVSTESAENVRSDSKNPVQTGSTTTCTETWYWPLVLVLEVLMIIFIIRKVRDKKKLVYVSGITALSTVIIFLLVCTKWYALLALLPLLLLTVDKNVLTDK